MKAYNLHVDSRKILLDKTNNQKLEALNKALSESKSLNMSTYASWVRPFDIGMRKGREIEFKAILSYWLSRYVLLSSLEDDFDSYVFLFAISLAQGERLAIVPIYLGSLFYRLDECIQNIVKSVSLSCGDSCHYHLFTSLIMGATSKKLSRKPTQYLTVEKVDMEENGKVVERPDGPYQPRSHR